MSTTADRPPPSSFSAGRIAAIVGGALVALLGAALLAGGVALLIAYATERDADGWFASRAQRLATTTPALTGETLHLGNVTHDAARWVADTLALRVRVRATPTDGRPLFVGIARARDVDRYLSAVAHDEVVDVDGDRVTYARRPGAARAPRPADRGFWAASSTGAGTRQVTWEATSGRWAAVVMHRDGSPGVSARVSVGARTGALPLIGAAVVGAGLVCALGAAVLLWRGLRRGDRPAKSGAERGAPGPR